MRDIECFHHHAGEYPVKVDCPYDGDFSIGASYTVEQFEIGEEKIKTYFLQQCKTMGIMNPLYQYNGRCETVITIDISQDVENFDKKSTIGANDSASDWLDVVRNLVEKHEERSDEIFSTGGDVSMKKIDGVNVSNDVILQDIEKHVQSIIVPRQEYLLQMVAHGETTAAKALQWIPKDIKIIDGLIDVLDKKAVSSAQQNLILRQLIPYTDSLDKARRGKTVCLMQDMLYYATPSVRNKVLSILSYLPSDDLRMLSSECQAFIMEISKTRQLNCSYPAREILEKLKSLET